MIVRASREPVAVMVTAPVEVETNLSVPPACSRINGPPPVTLMKIAETPDVATVSAVVGPRLTKLPADPPEVSVAHSQRVLARLHFRISPVAQPLSKDSLSLAASSPEIDEVAVVVPVVESPMASASIKPLATVRTVFDDPASIRPETSRLPVTVVVANVPWPAESIRVVPPSWRLPAVMFTLPPGVRTMLFALAEVIVVVAPCNVTFCPVAPTVIAAVGVMVLAKRVPWTWRVPVVVALVKTAVWAVVPPMGVLLIDPA